MKNSSNVDSLDREPVLDSSPQGMSYNEKQGQYETDSGDYGYEENLTEAESATAAAHNNAYSVSTDYGYGHLSDASSPEEPFPQEISADLSLILRVLPVELKSDPVALAQVLRSVPPKLLRAAAEEATLVLQDGQSKEGTDVNDLSAEVDSYDPYSEPTPVAPVPSYSATAKTAVQQDFPHEIQPADAHSRLPNRQTAEVPQIQRRVWQVPEKDTSGLNTSHVEKDLNDLIAKLVAKDAKMVLAAASSLDAAKSTQSANQTKTSEGSTAVFSGAPTQPGQVQTSTQGLSSTPLSPSSLAGADSATSQRKHELQRTKLSVMQNTSVPAAESKSKEATPMPAVQTIRSLAPSNRKESSLRSLDAYLSGSSAASAAAAPPTPSPFLPPAPAQPYAQSKNAAAAPVNHANATAPAGAASAPSGTYFTSQSTGPSMELNHSREDLFFCETSTPRVDVTRNSGGDDAWKVPQGSPSNVTHTCGSYPSASAEGTGDRPSYKASSILKAHGHQSSVPHPRITKKKAAPAPIPATSARKLISQQQHMTSSAPRPRTNRSIHSVRSAQVPSQQVQQLQHQQNTQRTQPSQRETSNVPIATPSRLNTYDQGRNGSLSTHNTPGGIRRKLNLNAQDAQVSQNLQQMLPPMDDFDQMDPIYREVHEVPGDEEYYQEEGALVAGADGILRELDLSYQKWGGSEPVVDENDELSEDKEYLTFGKKPASKDVIPGPIHRRIVTEYETRIARLQTALAQAKKEAEQAKQESLSHQQEIEALVEELNKVDTLALEAGKRVNFLTEAYNDLHSECVQLRIALNADKGTMGINSVPYPPKGSGSALYVSHRDALQSDSDHRGFLSKKSSSEPLADVVISESLLSTSKLTFSQPSSSKAAELSVSSAHSKPDASAAAQHDSTGGIQGLSSPSSILPPSVRAYKEAEYMHPAPPSHSFASFASRATAADRDGRNAYANEAANRTQPPSSPNALHLSSALVFAGPDTSISAESMSASAVNRSPSRSGNTQILKPSYFKRSHVEENVYNPTGKTYVNKQLYSSVLNDSALSAFSASSLSQQLSRSLSTPPVFAVSSRRYQDLKNGSVVAGAASMLSPKRNTMDGHAASTLSSSHGPPLPSHLSSTKRSLSTSAVVPLTTSQRSTRNENTAALVSAIVAMAKGPRTEDLSNPELLDIQTRTLQTISKQLLQQSKVESEQDALQAQSQPLDTTTAERDTGRAITPSLRSVSLPPLSHELPPFVHFAKHEELGAGDTAGASTDPSLRSSQPVTQHSALKTLYKELQTTLFPSTSEALTLDQLESHGDASVFQDTRVPRNEYRSPSVTRGRTVQGAHAVGAVSHGGSGSGVLSNPSGSQSNQLPIPSIEIIEQLHPAFRKRSVSKPKTTPKAKPISSLMQTKQIAADIIEQTKDFVEIDRTSPTIHSHYNKTLDSAATAAAVASESDQRRSVSRGSVANNSSSTPGASSGRVRPKPRGPSASYTQRKRDEANQEAFEALLTREVPHPDFVYKRAALFSGATISTQPPPPALNAQHENATAAAPVPGLSKTKSPAGGGNNGGDSTAQLSASRVSLPSLAQLNMLAKPAKKSDAVKLPAQRPVLLVRPLKTEPLVITDDDEYEY